MQYASGPVVVVVFVSVADTDDIDDALTVIVFRSIAVTSPSQLLRAPTPTLAVSAVQWLKWGGGSEGSAPPPAPI